MKNTLLILFIIIANACNSNTSEENKETLTKEEYLNQLYTAKVIPLFDEYDNLNLPNEIHIDEKDLGINAGAAFGYLEVSRGLVELEDKTMQVFALAHELAHIATIPQAKELQLKGGIPSGSQTNDYKKAEYLADLIAFHLISKKLTEVYGQLNKNLDSLDEFLGYGSFTHPSGSNRIKSLKKYIDGIDITNRKKSFSNRFKEIWTMN
ncbi:hypothetical protein [Mesonia aestuariivivens]|uniref:Peptidase M48 domain-containing protein n=1 Tax=Mesonia aestuariivivens TaxID=2796128 RepID=A0ABS6W1K0_9FLAO|nr:hypothetical protein [Mesonia aestuariivivens]MBW2961737.1 hypothetical protein [Mesonia aestuariivivens]